ncbi:hypothetical protein BCR36DRAFT_394948 [Piromyces finnis]|uniref:SSD domain-containing protein n=1 Tax=Piromyces finnis TaxID=1754191 RepID=A0A1Y1VKF6_9FUNG|nr:hypothetical protein BCR36DRAFT_394948 [Piromyces finnis]|eukprot:ORX58525.1 hypothetical protein BCR36DRAFT_394948 [Piromyces finnis]
MIISKIKNKLKKIIEIIESIFYYNAKFNSTYPLFTIISIVIFIIIFSAPVIQQLFLRINYLPEEQVQFLDTIYQPLNKINLENIEDNIKYNELLSITRSKIKNTNLNYKNGEPYSYLFEKDELNKIKNKTLQNLDKDKLGKYISIIEYVTVDTEHIDTEYVLGRGQGVINKNTIYQTWKIQNLLETMNVEIPEQYFQSQPNNKKLNIGAAADKTIENKNIHSNLNSSQENVKVTPLNNDNKNNLNLDNKNIPHKTFNLNDICVKNENKKCIIHSPLMIWKYNITKLEIDNNIIDTITSYIQNNVNETVSFHSMFSGISFSSTGKMKSSNALIITFFIESKLISGTTLTSSKAWTLLYKKVLNNIMDKKYQDIKISQYRISKISKELAYKTDKIDIIPSEYIVLFAIYVSLFIYISFSIGRIEFVKSKYILGFVAVISVSLSLIISLGFLEFLFGVNSSMFYPWSVFPYLIMTIGVENITVIVKSVVNTSIELPFTERYALGMKNISWEIIIPLIINVINISCGTFSSYSYISEFCFYTSLCIVFNFWLQTCLFGTVLSIDIKSLELYDLYKMQFEKNHKLIDRIGKNNIRYSSDNENKPYHPILDIKSEDFSDTESLDNTKNNNKRKVRWNWTVVFVSLINY